MCPLGAALRNTDKQNQMETLSGNVFSPAAAAPFGKLLLKEHIFGKYNANISRREQCASNWLHGVGAGGGRNALRRREAMRKQRGSGAPAEVGLAGDARRESEPEGEPAPRRSADRRAHAERRGRGEGRAF